MSVYLTLNPSPPCGEGLSQYLSDWPTRPQAREIAHRVWAILILLVLMIGERGPNNVLVYTVKAFEGRTDRLAYTVNTAGWKTSLMLYDPGKGTSTLVHSDNNFMRFSFSTDGRLAFSSGPESKGQIYVSDTVSARSSPVNISQNPRATGYPLAWSPDGHYLAFVSYLDNSALIELWDGKTTVNITPNDLEEAVRSYTVSWSFDGRLAFTAYYDEGYPPKGDFSEIYLWDGKTTTSLSQNPTGRDEGVTWSTDGRVAFLSARDGEYDIFVWDGVSVKNGSPDVATFTNVLPKLTAYFSFPVWTNNGLLAFVSQAPHDSHAQIYLWDGQTATNISQNPTKHNGSPTWSADGRWAFSTFFSPDQLIYARAADNSPILIMKGQSPAWSVSGYLTFCTLGSSGWVLSMWDGQQIVKIAQAQEIWSQWQSGSGRVCSSG